MRVEVWNVEEMCGYHPITTFWDDFVIAEHFGVDAIKDTYNRAFKHWKHDTKYLTELVMVLNHKIWRWHNENAEYAQLYDELYWKTHDWALDHLTGDDITYYLRTLD